MDYIVKKLVAKQLKAKGKKKGGSVPAPNPTVGFGKNDKKKKRGAAMRMPGGKKTRGGAIANRPISFGNTIEGLSF